MLIFHEGLPGSGKSYAAIKDHVIPALRKGRRVFAYIEGLDHSRIAQVSGITEEKCRDLLFEVERDHVTTIYDHVENDAFVVIDELQDFWPSSRTKLEPKITEFITQHRHRGLDVLLMGQVLGDCHVMWRNRVDQNVFFYNRDAVGKPNEYKWSVRKRQSNGKFQEVTSGVASYDPEYFGTYASHTSGTENTEKYVDERANVWASPVLRKTLPIYAGIALCALVFVWWMFSGGLVDSTLPLDAKGKGTGKPVAEQKAEAVKAGPAVVPTVVHSVVASVEPPGDLVDQLTGAYRIRVGGTLRYGERQMGWVEWRTEDGGVREVLSYVQLAGLGWLVMVSADGGLVTLSKLARKYYATAWPLRDVNGRASAATVDSLKPVRVDGGA